jgi:hypothetical protein
MELKAQSAFDDINKRAKEQPELIKKVGCVVVFDITKDGKAEKSWSKFHGKNKIINSFLFRSY